MTIAAAPTANDAEPYPLMPHEPVLSDERLADVEREWRVRLTQDQRQRLRFIVQLDGSCMHYHHARRSAQLEHERRARGARHRDIARLAKKLALEIDADSADESRAAPSLREKLAGVDLSLCKMAVEKIEAAARLPSARTRYDDGRPSRNQWEDFIVELAWLCRDAGGKPSAPWSNYMDEQGSRRLNAFWRGVAVINRELPPLARAPSVSGLAEKARKGKWLTRRAAGAKPATSRA